MKRILIIGPGGAGKSTLAKRLGARLQLEVIHLDSLFWSSGWVEMPKDQWRVLVQELVQRDSWIMDGNYGGTLDIRLAACDSVIFLDARRLICVERVLKRLALYRKANRPDMAAGCRERFNWEFIKYVWDYPSKKKPGILDKLKVHSQTKSVFILRSQAEIESFLANLTKTSDEIAEQFEISRGLTRMTADQE